jgi:pimeloyl-ACP methyl ester carboxylesterase
LPALLHDIEHAWIGAPAHAGAPLLVFLHEALGSVAQWRGFPQRLCEALACPGLVYSRAGHGRSAPRADNRLPFDFLEREAEQELPALLQALGVERGYVLFGHSDGASIALLHAAAFPDRVAGAIALAPHIVVEEMTVQGVAAARQLWQDTDLPARLARHHDDAEAVFRRWSERWLDPAFRAWTIAERMRAIRCPVLLIQGEGDEYGSLAQVHGIAERAPQAQVLALAGCGHSPHRDCPDAVIAATRDFLAALPVHTR